MGGLGAEGAFVAVGVSFDGRGGELLGGEEGGRKNGQGIAEETEGEDCEGEGVAGALGVAVEESG